MRHQKYSQSVIEANAVLLCKTCGRNMEADGRVFYDPQEFSCLDCYKRYRKKRDFAELGGELDSISPQKAFAIQFASLLPSLRRKVRDWQERIALGLAKPIQHRDEL